MQVFLQKVIDASDKVGYLCRALLFSQTAQDQEPTRSSDNSISLSKGSPPMYRPYNLHIPVSQIKQRTIKSVGLILITSVLVTCFPVTSAVGQTKRAKPSKRIGKIFIVSPKTRPLAVQGGSIPLRYNVNDPDITSVKIKIGND